MLGTMTPTDHDNAAPERDDSLLAAEYVIGVLSAEDRKAVEQRMRTDTAFAAQVEAWEVHFSPLADAYNDESPPPAVRQALDRRLFGKDGSRIGASGLWDSLALWRGLAVAALVGLAIAIAAPLLMPTERAVLGPQLVTLLDGDGNVARFVAVYDPARERIGLYRIVGETAAGRDFELWVIEGDQPPASLGIIPEGETFSLSPDIALRQKISDGATFAISLEPEGGSPTGVPTGPVVATGSLKRI
jgi:anti-sigma-K factor RskA